MISVRKGILLFVLIILLFSQCKKKETDYREKYIGNYSFTTHVIQVNADTILHDTTVQYSGSITLGRSTNDLFIKFLPQSFPYLIEYISPGYTYAIVDENGELSKPFDLALGWDEGGKFLSDSKVTLTMGDGLGEYELVGNKTK